MIDLNNTWCLNTEENYNALEKLKIEFVGDCYKTDKYLVIQSCFSSYSEIKDKPWFSQINKQIHLVNGEFQYVETKPKNNFKDYGFEADFEGEILKKINDMYIGYYLNKKNCPISCTWWDNGLCSVGTDYEEKYNLKPIKKEWYENPDNFPCLVFSSKINEFMVLDGPLVPLRLNDDFRPATKEEVLTLLVKE